jgi:hypothetical protein
MRPPRVLDGGKELGPVDPPGQIRVEAVAAVTVQNGPNAVAQPLQGVAQAVEGHVQVVTRGVVAVFGPLQGHQDVTPGGPVLVHQQVLEHGPGFQAVPPRHVPPGDAYLQRAERRGRDVGPRRGRTGRGGH